MPEQLAYATPSKESPHDVLLLDLENLINGFGVVLKTLAVDGDTARFARQAIEGAAAVALEAAQGQTEDLETDLEHLHRQMRSAAVLCGLELREESQSQVRAILRVIVTALKASLMAGIA